MVDLVGEINTRCCNKITGISALDCNTFGKIMFTHEEEKRYGVYPYLDYSNALNNI